MSEYKVKLNKNYNKLIDNYLFVTVKNKVNEFKENNRNLEVINLGIGDVTIPIVKSITEKMSITCIDMNNRDKFKGYLDEQGILELREEIKSNYYESYKIDLKTSEIFISDGACSDLANILDIFENNIDVVIPSPVYPAYVDSNIMKGNNIIYCYGSKENNFLPMPDYNVKCDLIYLCSPNNPTGSTYNYEQLKQWIDYALLNNAVIIFDSAYQIFIKNSNLPKSIYEIENSKKCAIEICSFSKTAGFTGLRCGYTIVPLDIENGILNKMWLRRQSTKFNGASYIVQQGAIEIFNKDTYKEIIKNIDYYLENARLLKECLNKVKIWNIGGENSPYIWIKCKEDMNSWEYFDYLLNKFNIVCTPGIGFGKNADGYVRFSCFSSREDILKAINKISSNNINI